MDKEVKKSEFLGNINKIKDLILGKGSSKESPIDKVDDILTSLSSKLLNKDAINYSETVKDVISKTMINGTDDYLKEVSTNLLADAETRDRLQRYLNAEEITDYIPYCESALQVITDEIVSPDDITKESIQILEETNEPKDEEVKIDIAYIRKINDLMEFDEKVYDIVYNTLKYGDQFIEIADFDSKDTPISTMLTEGKSFINEIHNITINEGVISETGILTKIEKNIKIELEIVTESSTHSILDTEESKQLTERERRLIERSEENSSIMDLNNIRLIQHDPAFVVKLQTKRFRLPIGYLVLPKPSSNMNKAASPYTTNPGPTGTGYTPGNMSYTSNSYWTTGGKVIFSGIDRVYLDMMKRIEKFVGKTDIDVDKEEIIKILKKVINEVHDIENNKLVIRFVPNDRMEHFSIKDRRFFPYGEGVFFKSTFSAKLLILQQVATSIKRMTESTERRAFYIETGLPRNTRNIIEQIKSALRKRKYSIDTFGTIGAIPSMVTSYEDIIIPQTKGKRFVEFDSIAPTQNARDAAEELKFFRDMLIGTLKIPPSYIGMEENTPSKANLSQESIVFARSIVAYQKQFSKCVKNLFKKIYRLTRKKNMPEVNITFPPPKLLQTEILAEHAETVRRIADAFEDMGISKDYTKKKYLNIDWDDVDKFKAKDDIEKKMENKPEDINMTPGYGGNVPPVATRFQ